jgi:hypothetical protein
VNGGIARFGFAHFDETESLRATRISIGNDHGIRDSTMGFEHFSQFAL